MYTSSIQENFHYYILKENPKEPRAVPGDAAWATTQGLQVYSTITHIAKHNKHLFDCFVGPIASPISKLISLIENDFPTSRTDVVLSPDCCDPNSDPKHVRLDVSYRPISLDAAYRKRGGLTATVRHLGEMLRP
jgi:hypothetical protein